MPMVRSTIYLAAALACGSLCLSASTLGSPQLDFRAARLELPDDLRLEPDDGFGSAVAAIGDVDGDGIQDLAVGATGSGPDEGRHGAIWILFRGPRGEIVRHRRAGHSGFFGRALAELGDLDGDGTPDLAVGAFADEEGGSFAGTVWILFLDPDGNIVRSSKIGPASAPLAGRLSAGDQFGISIANVGDLDGDGSPEIAVGAIGDDAGGRDRGVVWLIHLDPRGQARRAERLTDGLTPRLRDGDNLGSSVARIVPSTGLPMLAVGARASDASGTDRGDIWLLKQDAEGRFGDGHRLDLEPSTARPRDGGWFGFSASSASSIDDTSLLVGGRGTGAGELWLLRLSPAGQLLDSSRLAPAEIAPDAFWGYSITDIPGEPGRIIVGSRGDDSHGEDAGALWVVDLQRD